MPPNAGNLMPQLILYLLRALFPLSHFLYSFFSVVPTYFYPIKKCNIISRFKILVVKIVLGRYKRGSCQIAQEDGHETWVRGTRLCVWNVCSALSRMTTPLRTSTKPTSSLSATRSIKIVLPQVVVLHSHLIKFLPMIRDDNEFYEGHTPCLRHFR